MPNDIRLTDDPKIIAQAERMSARIIDAVHRECRRAIEEGYSVEAVGLALMKQAGALILDFPPEERLPVIGEMLAAFAEASGGKMASKMMPNETEH